MVANLRIALLLLLLLTSNSLRASGQELNTYELIKEFKSLRRAGYGEVAAALLRSQARELEAVLKEQPGNDDKRLELVTLQLRIRDHSAIVANLETILSRQPNNANAHALQAESLLYLQKFPAAEQAYRNAIELAPNNLKLRVIYGGGLHGTGLVKEAEAIARELMDLDARHPGAYLLNAAIEFDRWAYGKSDLMLQTAIALSLEEEAEEMRVALRNTLANAKTEYDEVYQIRMELAKTFSDASNELELLYLAPRLTKPVDPQRHIDRMYELHKSGKFTRDSFLREWFTINGKFVLVGEYFGKTSSGKCKFDFQLLGAGEKEKDVRVLVAVSPPVNEALRKAGSLAETETDYSLIGISGGTMDSYGELREPLTYEQAREAAVEIFERKRLPQKILSSGPAR